MASWRHILRQYDRGNITSGELFFCLMQEITEDNITDFLASVPPELLTELRSYIKGWPYTDGGWSKVKVYRLGCWIGAPSANEIEEAAMFVRHRCGVEVLRDAISKATISSCLLSWSGGTLPKLAQAIREERSFDRMPVIGDALEDAGAANVLIAHCRSRRPHFRSCWVLRGLLGEGLISLAG